MKTLFLVAAALLATTGAAFAIDSDTVAITKHYKPNKQMHINDVAVLMRGADYWCYAETDEGCDWAERYLEVDGGKAIYEVTNAWDDTRNLSFTDEAEFRDGRFICENGYNWVPSAYVERRETGEVVYGRELAQLKSEMTANQANDERNCFDYTFSSLDEDAGIITITQRQYGPDGSTDTANDAVVTLHYDTTDAKIMVQPW